MGQLRDRMEADLTLAGYADSTRRIYLFYAKQFTKHHMLSPAEMGEEEIRQYCKFQAIAITESDSSRSPVTSIAITCSEASRSPIPTSRSPIPISRSPIPVHRDHLSPPRQGEKIGPFTSRR